MKIVITGGGGFIGSHIVDHLLAKGNNEVVVIDTGREIPLNIENHRSNKNFTYIQSDITNQNNLKSIIDNDVDAIYHLAAVVGVGEYCRDPLKVIEVNTLGTRNVLEIARLRNAKIVFSSTSEIYGKNPEVPWKETSDRVLGDPTIDRWSYSTTKALCEHMIHAMHTMYNLPTVVVRYFNAYGPRQRPDFVISNMVHRVLNNKNPIVHDTGTQTRCFTFIKDIVEGTIEAANNEKANGKVFNIGSTTETRIKDLAEIILKLSGKNNILKCEYVDTKKIFSGTYEDLSRRIPDVTKAKNILGWQSTTSLESGIKTFMEWALRNKQWLERI